jgi:hypothetical protein
LYWQAAIHFISFVSFVFTLPFWHRPLRHSKWVHCRRPMSVPFFACPVLFHALLIVGIWRHKGRSLRGMGQRRREPTSQSWTPDLWMNNHSPAQYGWHLTIKWNGIVHRVGI